MAASLETCPFTIRPSFIEDDLAARLVLTDPHSKRHSALLTSITNGAAFPGLRPKLMGTGPSGEESFTALGVVRAWG